MNRKPPSSVTRSLRTEVGFGCPVPGCGNPYLEWHHFDPPWSVKHHHDPGGMIALCVEHHAKADAGAYTREQLHEFKSNAKKHSKLNKGRFDWLRNRMLAVVGGNFYYETPTMVAYRGTPLVWFNRDEDGYMLLNLRMLTTSKEPRAVIEDSFWLSTGLPVDLICNRAIGPF